MKIFKFAILILFFCYFQIAQTRNSGTNKLNYIKTITSSTTTIFERNEDNQIEPIYDLILHKKRETDQRITRKITGLTTD